LSVHVEFEIIVSPVGSRKGEVQDHLSTLVLDVLKDIVGRERDTIGRIPEQPLLALVQVKVDPDVSLGYRDTEPVDDRVLFQVFLLAGLVVYLGLNDPFDLKVRRGCKLGERISPQLADLFL